MNLLLCKCVVERYWYDNLELVEVVLILLCGDGAMSDRTGSQMVGLDFTVLVTERERKRFVDSDLLILRVGVISLSGFLRQMVTQMEEACSRL